MEENVRVMLYAVRERCSSGAVRGCLAIAACLALIAGPASVALAAEPSAAEVDAESIPPPVPDVPEQWETEPSSQATTCTGCAGAGAVGPGSRFYVDYDKGFAILPHDPEETPFSLKIRNQNMFRYDGFSRAESSWTDSAGNVLPINNSNYFGIPRGRLIFSGNALAPDLSYLLNIDYN